ncbi:hypothetical protein ABE073_04640 [Lederbergia citrisecunda]|uniref:hypothetical protein n=1 Tax=Lederbergia citrisecunda TaxID=2833583 RepID=UPI003D286D6A
MKKHLVIFRKTDRLLVSFLSFGSAHIEQFAMNPEFEALATNREDIFHAHQGKAYVAEKIDDAVKMAEYLQVNE